MKDYEIISKFVEYLQEHGHPGLEICRHPDQENRSSSDIDAIAAPFAIEHTSIDTLPNQRRNNDWFSQVIEGLEREFESQLSFRMSITFSYDAVIKGKRQDWIAIREALRNWIRENSPCLEYGKHCLNNIPGIPFHLTIDKRTSHIPGVAFWRSKPDDDTLSCRVKELLDRKAKKLNKYQDIGKTTVLLVESNDIALMDIHGRTLLKAIGEAYPFGLPIGVDKIWYVDTALPDWITFKDFTSDLLMREHLTERF